MRGALTVSIAVGVRTVLQGITFFLVARHLGVTIYGTYVAILALSMTLGNISCLGVNSVMLRSVAKFPESFSSEWGKTLASAMISTPILLLGYLAVGLILLPETANIISIVLIGLAEIVFSPIAIAGLNAAQALKNTFRAAIFIIAPAIPRFGASLGLIYTELSLGSPITTWAFFYFFATFLSTAYILFTAHRLFGPPRWPTEKFWLPSSIKEGKYFWMCNLASKALADSDKIILSRLTSLNDAGAYSIAHRIIEFALIPINSLMIASSADFFRAGTRRGNALKFALKIAPYSLLICLIIALLVYWAADYITLLLGDSYTQAIWPLKLLSVLPVVTLPRLLLQAALTAENLTKAVLITLVCGSLLVICTNILLIPTQGWLGAICAIYLSEIMMSLLFIFFLIRNKNASKQK